MAFKVKKHRISDNKRINPHINRIIANKHKIVEQAKEHSVYKDISGKEKEKIDKGLHELKHEVHNEHTFKAWIQRHPSVLSFLASIGLIGIGATFGTPLITEAIGGFGALLSSRKAMMEVSNG